MTATNVLFHARLNSMLPPRSAAEQGSRLASPAVLRDWLDHLPLANRDFALQRMLEALREFNATLMAPKRRAAMLEMFEHASAGVVDGARSEAHESFPMSAERLRETELATMLEREMALGHVEVACDLCTVSGKVPLLRRSAIAKALMRACLYQSAQLWQAFKTHGTPATGVWERLHDLFRFAVAANCADRESAVAIGSTTASVRTIYAQALLHAFAKPNQLTQAQNRQLHAALPVLASWCKLSPGYAPAGAIAVHAAGDVSPPTPPRGEQIDTEDRWMLDIGALLGRLDGLLAGRGDEGDVVLDASRGGGRAVLAASLVALLRRVWSERPERSDVRRADESRLETEVGLSGLHFILSGNQDFESALPLVDETAAPAASWALRTPGSGSTRRARARIVNRSRQGYCLHWSAGEDARVRVGELIALAPFARGERQWHYGALRWVRATHDYGIEAGVQVLPTAVAVAVYALDANGESRSPVRGILIEESQGGEAAILVPRPFVRGAAALEVLRMEDAATDAAPRPVRVARFDVREAGLYQKLVLPGETIERIARG